MRSQGLRSLWLRALLLLQVGGRLLRTWGTQSFCLDCNFKVFKNLGKAFGDAYQKDSNILGLGFRV